MYYFCFTLPTCIRCPAVKEFLLAHSEIKGELIDASQPTGLLLAQQYQVTSAPTVIIFEDQPTTNQTPLELGRFFEKYELEEFWKKVEG